MKKLSDTYSLPAPDPEAKLTASERLIRKHLLASPAPVSYAAVLIANLQARLVEEPRYAEHNLFVRERVTDGDTTTVVGFFCPESMLDRASAIAAELAAREE
jgi:hypothetical protein